MTEQEVIEKAVAFEQSSMANMSTSDRVSAVREAKSIVIELNQFYKESKDPKLMDIMKSVTEKKRKIEKRLR